MNGNNIKKAKFRWHDPSTGYQLAAGGILFYDSNGIWIIGEISPSSQIKYSDIGGKYTFEDGNIYSTISRELCEETYHTCELSTTEIEYLAEKEDKVYINGHLGLPSYMCLLVNMEKYKKIKFNPQMFLNSRNQIIQQNPTVPKFYYSSCMLKYLKYSEITRNTPLSFRLSVIIKCGLSKILPKDLTLFQNEYNKNIISVIEYLNIILYDTSLHLGFIECGSTNILPRFKKDYKKEKNLKKLTRSKSYDNIYESKACLKNKKSNSYTILPNVNYINKKEKKVEKDYYEKSLLILCFSKDLKDKYFQKSFTIRN